jgi:hypothetical protein
MATPIADTITRIRQGVSETTASYWTDAEIATILLAGARDLWRKIAGVYREHFITINDDDVTIPEGDVALDGVPEDVFIVVAIEPRVVGRNNPNRGLIFAPRKYTHPEFMSQRAQGPFEPVNITLFYDVMNAGAPVGAPDIIVAAALTSAVDLRLTYIHTLVPFDETGDNPIPGESDNALFAWGMAYVKAKENDQNAPDPEWMAVYGTEKMNLVAELAPPRSIQDTEVVEAFFQDLWP